MSTMIISEFTAHSCWPDNNKKLETFEESEYFYSNATLSTKSTPSDLIQFSENYERDLQLNDDDNKKSIETLLEKTVVKIDLIKAPEALETRRSPEQQYSENCLETSINNTEKFTQEPCNNLTSTIRRPCTIPTIESFSKEIQVITAETLTNILCGQYNKEVTTCKIIDCRFPYEYRSGHIIGATNMYTKKQFLSLLFNAFDQIKKKNCEDHKVLILYSEYSSERSLNFFHFLRHHDCLINKEESNMLKYPEIYLLKDGYRNFFATYPGLCAPRGYKTMWNIRRHHSLKYYNANPQIWKMKLWSESKDCAEEHIPMFFY